MKYIPLEDVMKILLNIPYEFITQGYSTKIIANRINQLPTIDPIQIIDEMIEENIKGGSIGELARTSAKMEVLQELKSRLSLTQK